MIRAESGDAPALERAAAIAVDLAGHLSVLADGIGLAGGHFPDPSPDWEGSAARAMARVLAARPEAFVQVARAGRDAASTLNDYAESLLLAAQLLRDADDSPEPLASQLRHRAAALAGQGAEATTSRLLALARLAPARPTAAAQVIEHARGVQSTAWLRAAESGEVVVSLASRAARMIERPFG